MGISRREALRRGVAIGGVMWTAPIVQAISVTSAQAAVPSPVPEQPPPEQPPEKPPVPPEQPPEQPPVQPPGQPPVQPPVVETPGVPGQPDQPAPPRAAGRKLARTGVEMPIGEVLAAGGALVAGGAAAIYASSREPKTGDETSLES